MDNPIFGLPLAKTKTASYQASCLSALRGLSLAIGLAISAVGQTTPAAQATPTPKPKLSKLTSYVVLISIGGLQGVCVTAPSNCQTQMITLQRWRENGVYALTAESVYPTQTLPAHATMLTGRLPVDHKITANRAFDELRGQESLENQDNTRKLKNETTLLSFLEKEKLQVGAVGFPMIEQAAIQTNHSFSVITNPTTQRPKETLSAVLTRDQSVLAKTLEVINNNPPHLLLVYFNALDTAQQLFGLNSFEAARAKKAIDEALEKISKAYEQKALLAETTFIVVSDHSALKTEQVFAPNVMLAQKGWIITDKEGQIKDWRAIVQPLGGAAMVLVKNQKDENDVLALFREIHEKPDSPLWRILTRQQAAKLGADERAALFLEAAPGFMFNGQVKGKLIEASGWRAISGHLPQRVEMRIGFILTGKGIKPNTKLDYARLTDLSPTIARLFGLEMRGTRGRVLSEVLNP